ncbi:uncharacterized protein LOC144112760 isoform X2 [Amblyomma americanum]
MPAVVPSPAAVARGRHSPFQRRSFSLWLSLFRPSCCRQPRTSSGSWPNRILCHRAVTTVASTRDPRAVCQPAQVALNSSHKGCSRPHLLFKEIDQHAAEVAADTEELLELIVTWSHGLKKQNTLLVLLNHPQVPVAMQNGILQLVTHVDSKVSKDLVKKLPEENQAMLLDTLVDLALDTPPSVQHSAVSGALRKVCFFGSLLVEPLQRTGVSLQCPARTVREAKKMRTGPSRVSPVEARPHPAGEDPEPKVDRRGHAAGWATLCAAQEKPGAGHVPPCRVHTCTSAC